MRENGCLQQIAADRFSLPQDVIAILLQGFVGIHLTFENPITMAYSRAEQLSRGANPWFITAIKSKSIVGYTRKMALDSTASQSVASS